MHAPRMTTTLLKEKLDDEIVFYELKLKALFEFIKILIDILSFRPTLFSFFIIYCNAKIIDFSEARFSLKASAAALI